MSKNHPNIYTKPQDIGKCSKWRDLVLLETLSDVKTAFGWNPALTCKVQKSKKKATPTYVRRADLFYY